MSLTFMTLVFDDAAGSLVGTVSTVILGVALPGLKYAPLVVALVLVKLASSLAVFSIQSVAMFCYGCC